MLQKKFCGLADAVHTPTRRTKPDDVVKAVYLMIVTDLQRTHKAINKTYHLHK